MPKPMISLPFSLRPRPLLLASVALGFAAPALADPAHVILTVPAGARLPADLAPTLSNWRQTGKIADSDYEPLKIRYTQQALAVMRAGNAPLCEVCGPRPEADAQFCSRCGSAITT